MQIAVEHITRYSFETEASYSIQSIRLTPIDFDGQRTIEWSIHCKPSDDLLVSHDGFGNTVHLMTVRGAHREIEIRASGIVDLIDRHGVVKGTRETVPLRVYLRHTSLTALSPGIAALASGIKESEPIPRLHELMGTIRDKVEYVIGTTHAETSAAEALSAGNGVCQDHAHIFIAAARSLGVPARYVTGYLLDDGEGHSIAHHAWAEAWTEGLGWVAFDVANRICPTDRYVRLSAGLDADYAAPIRGSRRGGGTESLEVQVKVQEQTSATQQQSQQ